MIPVHPKGPMILLKAKRFEQVSKGGIVLASNEEVKRETVGGDILEVMAVGDLAFKDHPQWGSVDPFCEVGDFVMTPRYPGHKFEYPPGSGDVWYLCNDETIKGVVDPNALDNFTWGEAV